ncbi:MAG: sigma-54-dependent Fis family transcriptional regulator [Candidatus Hydrogenedentes bacterium]|nr:sigma-54-dependent Fis family transcriptional regulator [Candidatus Hydrogenedentota bacterium]
MAKSSILVVDDEKLMREFVEEALLRAGYEVKAVANAREALEMVPKKNFDVVVTDLKMVPVDGLELLRRIRAESPETHGIVMTAYGTIETAVAAMKEGADDYILKPFAPDALELTVARALERRRLAQENRYLRDELNQFYDYHAMVGESPAMRQVYEQISKVANSRATILIRGETGVGKELVARAIHASGPRKDKPLIKVNCAALSASLLESELFGHEKGSFTGAHERKIGRFELADRGTLLLDEISEINTELQPKLLRALQEREIERVGGAQPIPIDTRIIATSNRNLEKAVEDGKFREDLFFRLNVIPIRIPPLRERTEDIPLLMGCFLRRYSQENGRNVGDFSLEAQKMFLEYAWPGNVRELQNAVERAVVLGEGGVLGPEHFNLQNRARTSSDGFSVSVPLGTTVAAMEKELILRTLAKHGENRTHAAQVLGISVRTLRNKIKEYGR